MSVESDKEDRSGWKRKSKKTTGNAVLLLSNEKHRSLPVKAVHFRYIFDYIIPQEAQEHQRTQENISERLLRSYYSCVAYQFRLCSCFIGLKFEWGSRGRAFKSPHSDMKRPENLKKTGFPVTFLSTSKIEKTVKNSAITHSVTDRYS